MSELIEKETKAIDLWEDPEETKKINVFLAWLEENGALFPKLSWPRNDTKSGIRGVIALDDIPTEDRSMLQIPIQLMMTPVGALNDPIYGEILKTHVYDLLYGDFLLAIYIMIELVREKDSFYYPYLSILPNPSCLSEWTEEELSLLQDGRVYLRAKNKKNFLNVSYDRIVKTLAEKYPLLFPLDQFTFSRFALAWNTIQARAFGRRLPWTALVPFADCLNHANVQTKYDYNVDENGVFRLFPTGQNSYLRGQEVFNSYGRRNNENLLLEYGFAMLDNEWDEVEIAFELLKTSNEDYFNEKKTILAYFGFSLSKMFMCSRYYLPLAAMPYLRVIYASPSMMEEWKAKEVNSNPDIKNSVEDHLIEELRKLKDEKEKDSHFNPYRNRFDERSSDSSKNPENYQIFRKIISLENELYLIDQMIQRIQLLTGNFSTSLEYDELLWKLGMSSDSSSKSKLKHALLLEIIFHLQDKYELNADEFDFTPLSGGNGPITDEDSEEEEQRVSDYKSLLQKRLFSALESDSIVLDQDIQDERILKVVHALTSFPSTLDSNGWSALVYRLTRKHIFHAILRNLFILKEYCQRLLKLRQENGSQQPQTFFDESKNPTAMIEDFHHLLTKELRELPTFPRNNIDHQYVDKLKLYLIELFES